MLRKVEKYALNQKSSAGFEEVDGSKCSMEGFIRHLEVGAPAHRFDQ
jgi:hypothetical protein